MRKQTFGMRVSPRLHTGWYDQTPQFITKLDFAQILYLQLVCLNSFQRIIYSKVGPLLKLLLNQTFV